MVASLVAVLIAGVVLLFIFFYSLGSALSDLDFDKKKDDGIEENSILHISLDKEIVDRAVDDPFANFPFEFGGPDRLGLDDVLANLETAAEDDNIEGIYLDLTGTQAGIATLAEVRDAILEFKESGKWVVAFSEYMSQSAYWVASAADEVYVYPEGGLDIKGLAAEIMFFKGTLDKLGVKSTIVRGPNNKYKSAVEPFKNEEMSESNREQYQRLLDNIWDVMVADITTSRGMSADELNRIADDMLAWQGDGPTKAVELGLIDATKYSDEVDALLREKVGLEDDNEELELVGIGKYISHNAPEKGWKGFQKDEDEEDEEEAGNDMPRVAVIYARGGINSGEGDEDNIGSDRIAAAIRKARKDSTVEAVVLRVNSPGGSALASDVIWREVVLCKAEKPVIASMGDVAASGGYYISCGADKIMAAPTTITGSIGVFGMLMNAKELFNDKLGITSDGVKTNEHADAGLAFGEFTEEELAIIQTSVDDVYYTFINKVAEGRNMDVNMVDSLGRGRVWTGSDAVEIGLVDELGGFEDAIKAAAEMADLEEGDYEVWALPEVKDPVEEFFKELSGEATITVNESIKGELGEHYQTYQYLKMMSELEGVQMRMPYLLEIK